MNLLTETKTVLKTCGKTPKDVLWVGDDEHSCSWVEFAKVANVRYDDGFGTAEVDENLVVVGDGWWMERWECDGSEGWRFMQVPTEQPPRATLVSLTRPSRKNYEGRYSWKGTEWA